MSRKRRKIERKIKEIIYHYSLLNHDKFFFFFLLGMMVKLTVELHTKCNLVIEFKEATIGTLNKLNCAFESKIACCSIF